MNILITGGAGYIGTELVNALVNLPEVKSITVYDNLSRGNYNFFLGTGGPNFHKVKFVKGELLDSRNLKKVLKGMDIVYHLAAKVTTPFANADAHSFEQVNHWGTAELIYAIEESDVSKVIYTSSTGVYGSSMEAVDEHHPTQPQTFYAITKLRGEEHMRRLQDKLQTYIFRCGNVYGYNKSMRFDAVINKFVFTANFNKRITIHGDGNQFRSFISIDKIGTALANVLTSSLPAGTYNLTDKNLKILDVVDYLKQIIPDMEFIFINQHMKMQELNVKRNDTVNAMLGIEHSNSFKSEIENFLSKFSF